MILDRLDDGLRSVDEPDLKQERMSIRFAKDCRQVISRRTLSSSWKLMEKNCVGIWVGIHPSAFMPLRLTKRGKHPRTSASEGSSLRRYSVSLLESLELASTLAQRAHPFFRSVQRSIEMRRRTL